MVPESSFINDLEKGKEKISKEIERRSRVKLEKILISLFERPIDKLLEGQDRKASH